VARETQPAGVFACLRRSGFAQAGQTPDQVRGDNL